MRKIFAGLAALCTAITLTACSNGSGKDAAPSRDEIVAGLNQGFSSAIKETGTSAPAGLQEAMLSNFVECIADGAIEQGVSAEGLKIIATGDADKFNDVPKQDDELLQKITEGCVTKLVGQPQG
ncbi:hypothetical protein ACXITP_02295 [Actinotignum sanguinis]|uniref:Lipoprotein n=2 Tax=Actinomycetaceae TaxID=2049 RepID=A0ABZ0RC49_9ACTO|nr:MULTISPECIES: hypothetical protein [Actinotignum]WPJ89707.1 hypothetical protein R0V15_03705 [Schaalia turicensis]MDE1552130.1 hypothetical protein [Actinotignum sanguinis]MDE1565255.1 hypothetical protein [Actinotignum sanguinis]MDE1577414.1 hypothetical protein [Actinotignum sanguinis]MDE1642268.1 hypothetical protein [Actinotignum sanguinis]